MILLVAMVALAGAPSAAGPWGDRRFVLFPDAATAAPSSTWAGEFASPPVADWNAELPGGRVNAASHTERTRPVVTGDGILVGSAAGKALYLVSRTDGRLLRTYPAAASVESAPAVVGDAVYFADTGGIVWCYGLDGTERWSHPTGAPVLTEPVVDAGVAYVTNVNDLAVALDARTGELVWQYQRKPDVTRTTELALYARPPAVVAGDLVLLGFSEGSLVAVDRKRGEQVWDKRIGEGRYPDLVAAPVLSGTDIVAAGYFEPLVAIDLASRNVRWRVDVGAASAVALGTIGGSPVVYHPGTDGKLRAIVTLTGAESWTWDSETGGALTTPLVTPAGLLVGSSSGGIWLVDPATGATVWTYAGETLLDGVSATPTIDGRQLLFTTDAGRLYSMVVPRKADAEELPGIGWWR
jgi:outer membrane protein assembly factor BamB